MKKNDEKVDLGKRMFFRRAAAAVGGIAAAGAATVGLTKPATASREIHDKLYTPALNDDQHQEQLMSQKRFVLMSDNQKAEMLDEIIRHHHSVTHQS